MRAQRLTTALLLTLLATTTAFATPDDDVKREKQREVHADREKTRVIESEGCPAGAFNVVTSPDGNSVSVLFDNFVVNSSSTTSGLVRKTCAMEIPLHLPAGFSLGVYQLDYRGFAHLEEKQRGELQVNYGTGEGEQGRGRRSHRDLKGTYDGDFLFNERLKGGVLRRMGCGASAVLNFAVTLTVISKERPGEGRMTLDSTDGASPHGLVFGLNLKKCGEPDNN